MKGIFLTEQGKKEIEDSIKLLEYDLEQEKNSFLKVEQIVGQYEGKIRIYKDILSLATILPIEEDWSDVDKKGAVYAGVCGHFILYPNGVIIQGKK